MSQWALPAIAVMLLAYGAVSGRLRSTPVSQAMVFVALGLLAGGRVLDLVRADTVAGSAGLDPAGNAGRCAPTAAAFRLMVGFVRRTVVICGAGRAALGPRAVQVCGRCGGSG